MAVRVERGLMAAIKENPSSIYLQVRSSDDVRAAAAMDAARMPISDALEPNWISDVTSTPHGPYLNIDAKLVDEDSLKVIPEILVRHLEEAGLTDAVVAPARIGGPLLGQGDEGGLDHVKKSVILRLYPPPPPADERGPISWIADVPKEWVDETWSWIQNGAGLEPGEVMAAAGMVEFPLPANGAREFMLQGNERRTRSMVAAGDKKSRIWVANVTGSPWMANLAVGFGGPAATDDELLQAFDELCDLARRLAATVAYGLVSLERTLGNVIGATFGTRWAVLGGMQAGAWGDVLLDEIVLDAFPFQVLCPGHLLRLGDLPAGSEVLDLGRVSVSIGDAADWLLRPEIHDLEYYEHPPLASYRRDPAVEDRARGLLRPCLMTSVEASDLSQSRRGAPTALRPDEINPVNEWRRREL